MSKTKQTAAESSILTPDDNPPQKRVVHVTPNGQIVVPASSKYFDGFAKASLPDVEIIEGAPIIKPSVDFKKMPWDDWCQIVAFHKWSVATYRAETCISHLIDRNMNWVHCPFHQQVRRGAMTIEVKYDTPENMEVERKLREELGVEINGFHGSTHNHVVSSAFSSGTDVSDETTKQGIHITVGKCDKDEIDIHGRVRIIFPPLFDEEDNRIRGGSSMLIELTDAKWARFIEVPGYDPSMPAETADKLVPWWLMNAPDNGFPEEWKEYITENKAPTYQGGAYQGGGHHARGNGAGGGTATWKPKGSWPWNTQNQAGSTPSAPSTSTSTSTAVTTKPDSVKGARLTTTALGNKKGKEKEKGSKAPSSSISADRHRKHQPLLLVISAWERKFADKSKLLEAIGKLDELRDVLKDDKQWGLDSAVKVLGEDKVFVGVNLAISLLETEKYKYDIKENYSVSASCRTKLNRFLDDTDETLDKNSKK